MIVCPKCGSVAERDTAGNIVCTCQSCNWSDYINETNKGENNLTLQSKNMETKENNSNAPLRYYYVEYINEDSELLQASCIYDLIEKILKQEGEFTPFVEKCYCAFTKSSISELIQFYNNFSE